MGFRSGGHIDMACQPLLWCKKCFSKAVDVWMSVLIERGSVPQFTWDDIGLSTSAARYTNGITPGEKNFRIGAQALANTTATHRVWHITRYSNLP